MIPSPTNPIRSDIFKSFYLFNLVDCAVECIFHRFQHDSDWRLFMYAKLILLVQSHVDPYSSSFQNRSSIKV